MEEDENSFFCMSLIATLHSPPPLGLAWSLEGTQVIAEEAGEQTDPGTAVHLAGSSKRQHGATTSTPPEATGGPPETASQR